VNADPSISDVIAATEAIQKHRPINVSEISVFRTLAAFSVEWSAKVGRYTCKNMFVAVRALYDSTLLRTAV